jgi:hypothetical protein
VASVDLSSDMELAERGMERRKLLLAGGSLITAAVLGGAQGAVAHDGHDHDVNPNLAIAKVEAHESSRIVRVTRIDNAAAVKVVTTASTVLPAPGDRNRALSEVTAGETVVVIAPDAASAGSGRTVTAQRIVHCNIGVYADAKRIRALESK